MKARRAAPACSLGYKAMQARIGAIAQLYDLISRSSSSHAIAVDGYLKEIARTVSGSLLGEARLTARGLGDRMELTVANDGVGIRSPTIDEEPPARGSEYIGIFVRQLCGELTTSSVEEAGTTVTIRLPMEAA